MATCENIQSQLSAFIDNELTGAERDAVAAHVATCEACSGVAADLRRLAAAARELGPIAPPADGWTKIAQRTRVAAAPARRAVLPWMGIAASFVLITAAVYVLSRVSRDETTATPPAVAGSLAGNGAGNANAPQSVELLVEELKQAETHYETAIAQLDAIVSANGSALDPAMQQVLQTNLPVLDRAIAQSRAALESEPGSAIARDSLFEALRNKVSVLQDTVALMR